MIDPRRLPNTATARLPENYLFAKDALRRCAKHFTPEAYARIADDDELRRLIRQVGKRRIKWKAINPDPPHE